VHKQPDPPRLRNWKCRQVYHVYQRGSRRQNTFLNPMDSVLYLDKLDVFARRYKVRIHCFCLMSNHVHFMLEPLRKGAISRLMQHLQSQYARHVHHRLNTQGHLWHHHFHAKLIRSETQRGQTREKSPPLRLFECQSPYRQPAPAHRYTQEIQSHREALPRPLAKGLRRKR